MERWGEGRGEEEEGKVPKPSRNRPMNRDCTKICVPALPRGPRGLTLYMSSSSRENLISLRSMMRRAIMKRLVLVVIAVMSTVFDVSKELVLLRLHWWLNQGGASETAVVQTLRDEMAFQ